MLVFICAIEDAETADHIAELYLETKDALLRFAQSIVQDRALAEDAVHSAFQIIINRPQLLRYKEAEKNKAYMMVIVRNLSLNYLRDHKRECLGMSDGEAEGPTMDDALFNKEDFLYAKEVLGQLPKTHQDAIFLKYEMGYDNEQIAQLLGISYDNVRQRISRGLRKARTMMEGGDGVAQGRIHRMG